MSRTVSVTLPDDLYRRLEELRREKGGAERSRIIQQALAYYLSLQGPDPKVVRRWKEAYAKAGDLEEEAGARWQQAQAKALGQP